MKVPESDFETIKGSLLTICASTSRSSKPAIYGLAAEAEIRRLRPLSTTPAALEVPLPIHPHPPTSPSHTLHLAFFFTQPLDRSATPPRPPPAGPCCPVTLQKWSRLSGVGAP